MGNQKFLRCGVCGNLFGVIEDSGVPAFCCGQEMTVLEPNSTGASLEKHIPQLDIQGDTVSVSLGSQEHPMTGEHYIQWVYVKTANGAQRRRFEPGDEPKATFTLGGQELLAVYAYCNLHGLWMAGPR